MAKSRPEEDSDHDERPRRKRKSNDVLSDVIPYHNLMALIAYYSGFGGLIAILGGIALNKAAAVSSQVANLVIFGGGGLFALLGVVLGILGLGYANNNPEAKGTGHALTGIVMGALEGIGLVVLAFLGGTLLAR